MNGVLLNDWHPVARASDLPPGRVLGAPLLDREVAVWRDSAGALHAFSKGSISPESMAVPRSVDGLVMVLLGGIQTLTGPLWGAALFTWLQDAVARGFDYWRAAIGVVILALVLVLPGGLGSLGGILKREPPR